MQVRTILGTITVKSPRLRQCPCQPHTTETCRPLTAPLPEHIAPELLFLETKWAALASYGVTAQLLQDVLPFDETRYAFTIRQHVYKVAEWLEQALGGGTVVVHRQLSRGVKPLAHLQWPADRRH